MDNHDFVGLFDANDYDALEEEVNFILHKKCKLLPLLEDCKMRRIDFCINAELKNQEQVKAYIKTMKRANVPNHLNLYEVYDEKAKRTKPTKDDFPVYSENYVAISIYNKQRQMIKEQKEKKKVVFPPSEIDRAENIARIEIRYMEGKVSELKKKFNLKSIYDFMIFSGKIGDYLFSYYLSRIFNDGIICTLSEALKRIDMGEYKPESTELLKEFIRYANETRSVAETVYLYRKFLSKKEVNRMIWMLSNVETNYVTATTEVVKLFDNRYIPTPLELYEDCMQKQFCFKMFYNPIEKGIYNEDIHNRLEELKVDKTTIETEISKKSQFQEVKYTDDDILQTLTECKELIRQPTNPENRWFLNKVISKIVLYRDEVLIVLKTGLSVNDEFDTEIRATRKEIYDYGRRIKNAS